MSTTHACAPEKSAPQGRKDKTRALARTTGFDPQATETFDSYRL
jgi:hypothetical protein